MAGGPRKFSEKIALLNQKEAEATAAFYSVMNDMKGIRSSTSNSGSQLDMLDPSSNDRSLKEKNHSSIEDTIGYDESVNITYMNDQSMLYQFNKNILKNNEQLVMMNDNNNNQGYLQLPNQNDSFRRAHSDSSLNQSVSSNFPNSNLQLGMNFQQPSQDQNYQQQQQQPQFQQQCQQQQQFQQSQFYLHNQQQQQQQQNIYQQQPSSPFIQGTNEYNAIPFRNFSLPIASQMAPSSLTNFNQTKSETKLKNLSSPTKTNALSSPTSALSPTSLSPHHIKNEPNNNLSPVYIQQLSPQNNTNQFVYPPNLQQQQFHPQNSDQLLSPTIINNNNNFLNTNNMQNTAGGSLPDLTSFQYQNNQSQQMLQLQEYNNKRIHHQQQQQQQQQHQHQQQQHQLQQPDRSYDFSSQMLQPNFQQHNHIGPVKPTHSNSVSPVRGGSRYSPTHTSSNTNSISNRRSSPQHLGLNKQSLNSLNTSAQSSPTSPLHPSAQNFPALEFTISNYVPSSPNLSSGHSQNNIVYRTNSASTCTTGAESLPPSPQSQHSCFNSPQGSPGPISISPQDMNPFTSNNNINNNNSYDIMQKKFDSINLETNKAYQNIYGQYSPGSALSPTSPTGPSQNNIVLSPRSPTNLTNNGNISPNMNGKITSKISNNGIETSNNNNINTNTTNDNNNNNKNNDNTNIMFSNKINKNILNDKNTENKIINGNLDEIGARNKHLKNENFIMNNQMNNNNNNQIELNQMNISYNLHFQNHHQHQQNNNNIIKNQIDTNNLLKAHKNSIPNIIFTFSGDSIDDKNDNIIKEMTNDLIYSEDLLMNKNEQFDLDLQMLSDPVNINDHETNSKCNGIYQNI